MQYQYLSVTKCVLAYFEHTRNKNVVLWYQIAMKPFQHSVASCSYGGNLESKFCCVFLWIERQWQNKCLHGEVVWAYRFHIILYLYLECFTEYICGLHSCAFIWRFCSGLQISWKFDFENTRKKKATGQRCLHSLLTGGSLLAKPDSAPGWAPRLFSTFPSVTVSGTHLLGCCLPFHCGLTRQRWAGSRSVFFFLI